MNEISKIWWILSWLFLLSTRVDAATPSEDLRFYKKAEYAAGIYPLTLSKGNFDENTFVDLAVGGLIQTNLFIFSGNGDGTFKQSHALAVPGSHRLIRWGTNSSAPDSLLSGFPMSQHNFQFDKVGQIQHRENSSNLWIASPVQGVVTREGTPNPILGIGTNWLLELRESLTDATPTPISTTNLFHQPGYLWGGDLNADSIIDWVVISSSGHIMTGLSQGSSYREQTFNNIDCLWVHPVDLDHDELKELVACGRHGRIILLKQRLNSFFQDQELKGAIEPQRVQSADLDRDGLLDLVVSDRNESGLKIYRGQGDLKFFPPFSIQTAGLPGEFVIEDFNGDERLDLAITSSLYSKLMIFLQGSDRESVNMNSSAKLLSEDATISVPPVETGLPIDQPQTTIHLLPRNVQLPQNRVLSILQTSEGFLWFGTLDGLGRYDGHELISYTRSSYEALSGTCQELAEGEAGELWVGTNDGLLHFKNNHFTKYLNEHPPMTNGLRHWNIGALLYDKRTKNLWVGTDNGLQLFSNGIFHDVGPSLGITALHLAGEKLIVGTSTGVFRFDQLSMSLIPLNTWESPLEITDIISDDHGRVWAARIDGTVIVSEKDRVARINGRNLPRGDVGRLNLRQPNFLITRADLFSFDSTPDGLRRFENVEWGEIFCRHKDPEGTLWIGTSLGVYRLQQQPFHTINSRAGLSHDDVWSIVEGQDGTLWAGTRFGLNTFRNGQWRQYFRKDGLNSNFIYALCPDSDNRIWIGNNKEADLGPAGVNCILAGSIICGNGTEFTWTSGRTRSIFQDSKKRLWVATEEGLWVWQGNSVINLTTRGDFKTKTPLGTLEDTEGNLWFGSTDQGVFRYDGNSFHQFDIDDGLSSNYSAPLLQDEHGAIWFGSANGLSRYRDGIFSRITPSIGLFDSGVFCLLEDDQGYYWMSSNRGIYKAHKDDLNRVADKLQSTVRCIAYSHRDGLLSSEGNGGTIPAACKTSDGRLWFATTKGIAVVDPGRLSERQLFFPPKLESISINGVPHPTYNEVLGHGKEIVLGFGVIPLLQLSYTVPAFEGADLVQFQYQLEGQDANWRSPVKERLASYTNLKPGIYRFHLRARKGQSEWLHNTQIFAFQIAPRLHQRASVQVTAAIAFMSALFVLHSWRLQKQKRLREMQQNMELEKERCRIAQDLHDQLGSTVGEVTLLAEIATQEQSLERKNTRLHSIKETLSEVSDALSEVVWALNTRNDSLRSLVEFLRSYASKILNLRGINLDFHSPENVTNTSMDARVRHAIVLIVKEALHNVLKHSSATAVDLRLSLDRNLEIVIKDNGRGFDPAIPRDGNGLYNMEQRAGSINGQLSIQSAPTKGTQIRLQLPLSIAEENPHQNPS